MDAWECVPNRVRALELGGAGSFDRGGFLGRDGFPWARAPPWGRDRPWLGVDGRRRSGRPRELPPERMFSISSKEQN